MHFLETIEGRSGEELTSAILKYLLIHSSTMRECFANWLHHQLPPSKRPTFRDGIICRAEFTGENSDSGRLDLLIREAAGMVFGLENKLWADFTPEQPKKYWESVLKEASNDRTAIDVKSRCRLIVLYPKHREEKIKEHVTQQGIASDCCYVHWETVCKDLDKVRENERDETRAIATFFQEYVSRQLFSEDIDIAEKQLLGSVAIPNDFHYDFLYRLKTRFPGAERIRGAKQWVGFHFFALIESERPNQDKQWCGFGKFPGDDGVVFGLHFAIKKITADLPPLAQLVKGFYDYPFVKVEFDSSLKTATQWYARLLQVIERVRGDLRKAGAAR